MMQVEKYVLQLIREIMHLISTLKSWVRKLVQSFKLKEWKKLLSTRQNTLLKGKMHLISRKSNIAAKNILSKRATKGTFTVLSLPDGI